MAGADPAGAFDADSFRTDIRAAMAMGMPEDQEMRPIFLFPREQTFDNVDKAGVPWDYSEAPLTDTGEDEEHAVRCGTGADEVLCAWEAGGGRGGTQSNETPFGDFDALRLVLTILDVDYAKIAGFDRVLMSGNEYRYQFEEPQIGLFDVTIYQVVVGALDES